MFTNLSDVPIYYEGNALYGSYRRQKDSWQYLLGETINRIRWSLYQAMAETTTLAIVWFPHVESWLIIRYADLWRGSFLFDDENIIYSLYLRCNRLYLRNLNDVSLSLSLLRLLIEYLRVFDFFLIYWFHHYWCRIFWQWNVPILWIRHNVAIEICVNYDQIWFWKDKNLWQYYITQSHEQSRVCYMRSRLLFKN